MHLIGEALTFDDVSLEPAYSEVLPSQVRLNTRLTREININAPLISAAMDTVTDARLAIAMAQEGGIGVIHKNMSLQKQAEQVHIVKIYEAGVIKDPITVAPHTTIREVLDLTRQHNISGVPVVDGNELVGIVTSRDMRFEKRLDDPVRNIMTAKESLITVREDASQDEVLDLLHKHRIEKVLVVNGDFELRGLITVKDIQKSTDFPNAAKDSQESLLVAAAVGVGGDTEERVTALVEAKVDVIVVDTAHGHTQGVRGGPSRAASRTLAVSSMTLILVWYRSVASTMTQGAWGVSVRASISSTAVRYFPYFLLCRASSSVTRQEVSSFLRSFRWRFVCSSREMWSQNFLITVPSATS